MGIEKPQTNSLRQLEHEMDSPYSQLMTTRFLTLFNVLPWLSQNKAELNSVQDTWVWRSLEEAVKICVDHLLYFVSN